MGIVEVAIYLQFSALMMLIASVLLACAVADYHQRKFRGPDKRARRRR